VGCTIPGWPPDPAPLSFRQVSALLGAAARELSWGLRSAASELRVWRGLARSIPDVSLRDDALGSLARKRTHADGAALFSILPRRRSSALLRVLVAYETALDYLDNVNEHHLDGGNGRQLHLALLDALDPQRGLSDYYRHHVWRDDRGYLRALVATCRAGCRQLPGYPGVRRTLCRETARALVLGINHECEPQRRECELRRWAARECAGHDAASWFELSGAASASLTVHALLALAAEENSRESQIDAVLRAYFPWIAATSTMLDSFVDQDEDRIRGGHSYVAHYPSRDAATVRIGELVERSLHGARSLDRGHRHAVIAACMVAMYLSKDSARTATMRAASRRLVRSGGSLSAALLPVLRLWRIAYALRSA
jgi:tetraprenyl-beta-curcumene synthase